MREQVRYLVFAGDDDETGGGAHEFVEAFEDSFTALAEMVEHTTWAHVAEFDGQQLVIVAEREGASDLKLYPERMAHQKRPAPADQEEGQP